MKKSFEGGISPTQEKIMRSAQDLIQHKGLNAFSYKDIAHAVGIKTSSIHYHYPTKEDLVGAVLIWQQQMIFLELTKLKQDEYSTAKEKLDRFLDLLFSLTYKDNNKMCLGGMLASDVITISDELRNKVQCFFDQLLYWIEEVLKDGLKKKEMSTLPPKCAEQVLIHIEGALLLARLYKSDSYIKLVKDFLESLFD